MEDMYEPLDQDPVIELDLDMTRLRQTQTQCSLPNLPSYDDTTSLGLEEDIMPNFGNTFDVFPKNNSLCKRGCTGDPGLGLDVTRNGLCTFTVGPDNLEVFEHFKEKSQVKSLGDLDSKFS